MSLHISQTDANPTKTTDILLPSLLYIHISSAECSNGVCVFSVFLCIETRTHVGVFKQVCCWLAPAGPQVSILAEEIQLAAWCQEIIESLGECSAFSVRTGCKRNITPMFVQMLGSISVQKPGWVHTCSTR